VSVAGTTPILPPEPTDLPTARRVISELSEQLKRQQREIEILRDKVDSLCRKLWGRSSEQVSEAQLKLAFAQLGLVPTPAANETPETEEMDSGERVHPDRVPRRPKGRQPLPKNLPRRQELVDLSEAEKVCACGEAKQMIGEATAEKYDYVPASVWVLETVTPKYACPRCHEGVSVASAPPQAVEKGLATESLLAYVVTSKYADHLPLNRLESIFVRQGALISRSTMCGWVADVAEALSPIGEQLREEIRGAPYLQTDDTPVTVLGDSGGSFKGRLWVYLDPLARQVVYDATATHEGAGPQRFLEEFRGYLQADAYAGYDALYASRRIVEVACWAHARRRFVEALETDPRAAIVVALVKQLYEIESEAATCEPDARRLLRQDRSRPVLAELDSQRQTLMQDALPKSPLGDALRYLDNQWLSLQRFLEDGRLRIDNNGAESQLRVVAVGRNNWLFAGSMVGAERAALLYSLVQSCRLVKVDPFLYFRDVLLRVATHPQSRIAELTPKSWAAAQQINQ
jgi:transposase